MEVWRFPFVDVLVMLWLMSLVDQNGPGFSAFVRLITVWMVGMMPIQAMQTLQMSQHYLAADIFAIAPLPSAAPVFHGVRKATIYYLLVPAFVIATILIAYLAPGGSPGLLLALPGVVAIPVVSLISGLMEEYLPLSRPAARGEQSSRNMSLMFLTMFAMAGVLAVALFAWSVS